MCVYCTVYMFVFVAANSPGHVWFIDICILYAVQYVYLQQKYCFFVCTSTYVYAFFWNIFQFFLHLLPASLQQRCKPKMATLLLPGIEPGTADCIFKNLDFPYFTCACMNVCYEWMVKCFVFYFIITSPYTEVYYNLNFKKIVLLSGFEKLQLLNLFKLNIL